MTQLMPAHKPRKPRNPRGAAWSAVAKQDDLEGRGDADAPSSHRTKPWKRGTRQNHEMTVSRARGRQSQCCECSTEVATLSVAATLALVWSWWNGSLGPSVALGLQQLQELLLAAAPKLPPPPQPSVPPSEPPALPAPPASPPSPPPTSPPPDLLCYVQRYADLLDGFCGGELSRCDWPLLQHHWEAAGRSEGRKYACSVMPPSPPSPPEPPAPPQPPPPPIRPECDCFDVCNHEKVHSWHLRLPVVRNRASPWYKYLQTVYHGDVPLPQDLQTYSYFYSRFLPFYRCHGAHNWCEASVCAKWLNVATPTREQLQQHMRDWETGTDYWPWPPDPDAGPIEKTSLGDAVVIRTWQQTTPQTWYEVTRYTKDTFGIGPPDPDSKLKFKPFCTKGEGRSVGDYKTHYVGDPVFGAAEGAGYGCWFSGVKGTGIFLRVDQMLWLTSRDDVKRRLPNTDLMDFDCLFAEETRRAGFDGLVITQALENRGLHPSLGDTPFVSEIVAAQRDCMVRTDPLPTACPPEEGPYIHEGKWKGWPAPVLRTGWNASLPCHCVGRVGPPQNLNCGRMAPYYPGLVEEEGVRWEGSTYDGWTQVAP